MRCQQSAGPTNIIAKSTAYRLRSQSSLPFTNQQNRCFEAAVFRRVAKALWLLEGTKALWLLEGTKALWLLEGTKALWLLEGTKTLWLLEGTKALWLLEGTKALVVP